MHRSATSVLQLMRQDRENRKNSRKKEMNM